jgi:hypothetical protein
MPNLFELIANEQRQNRAKLDRRQAALDEVKSVSAFDPEAGSADNFLNGVKKDFSETWQQTEITLGQLVNNDPETWQAVEDGAVGAAEWAWGTVTLDKETWSNTADAVKGAVGDAVDYGKAVIDAPDDPRAAYEAGQGALGVATTFVPGVGVAGKATKVADKAGDLGDAGRKAAAKRGSEAPDQPPCTTGHCPGGAAANSPVKREISSEVEQGQHHKRAAEKGFPGVETTPNGGPTFKNSDFLFPTGPGEKNVVEIELTGSRRADFRKANEMAGVGKYVRPGADAPSDYTWHHVDDYSSDSGTGTLELVQRKAHKATLPHKGGVAQWEEETGLKYKR